MIRFKNTIKVGMFRPLKIIQKPELLTMERNKKSPKQSGLLILK